MDEWVEFRILGPVRIRSGEREDAVGGSKQRTMLAALLLADGRTVSDEDLSRMLWGDHPPITAHAQIHTYASRIRQRVRSSVRIERISTGYGMSGDIHLDHHDFRRLAASARREAAAERYGATAELLERALALWQGEALADTTDHMIVVERPRLEEQLLEAVELRIEAELVLRRQEVLVPELETLVRRYPLRERLRALLMTALYRVDRQADAIAVFQDCQRILDEELGVTPGRLLASTYRGLLTGEARFRLYAAGQGLSRFGTSFTTFALPLMVYRITSSPLSLGLTMVASFLPYLLFGLVIGALVDRVDREKAMVRCELARAAVLVLTAVSVTVSHDVAVLFAGAFVMTALSILFNAGGFAAVPHLVAKDRIVWANARLQLAYTLGALTGPTIAGLIVLKVPPATVLYVDATTYLVSALSLLIVRGRFDSRSAGSAQPAGSRWEGLLADIRDGVRTVWDDRVLRSIANLMLWVNFFDATLFAQLILFAKQRLSASDTQVAWLFGAAQIGILAMAWVAGRVRKDGRTGPRIVGAQLACGVPTIVFGLNRAYLLGLVIWAAYSGLSVFFNIHTSSLRQRIVPEAMLGRVITVSSFLTWSSIPLGAALGAVTIDRVGDVGIVYTGIGVLTTLAALAAAFGPLLRPSSYPLVATGDG